ncbi:substrate-binding periplasmic protein [Kiloniella antarctica]|uniref:Substrate-binding periplasmic protein n=1 Tax=Kiloniella antarctica TaxID=1550907 RepID=A0ABW5BNS0_9PROT
MIFISTITFGLSLANASHLKLRIGYNENSSYPYFLGQGPLPANPPGLSVEILEIIANELSIEIEFIRMPGQRVLRDLEDNRLDAAFIFSFKPERQKFGVYPMVGDVPDRDRRLAVLTYMLYKPVGSDLNWNGVFIENLRGVIGANTGYSIVDDLRKKGIPVEETKSTAINFLKMRNSRIAGVADQEIVADAYLQKNNISGVEKILRPLVSKDYFLIFSHLFSDEHPDIRDKIWQLITEKRDELSEQLIPKYLTNSLDGNL